MVPFAHDPITSTLDETEASHVHAAKEEEEEEEEEGKRGPLSVIIMFITQLNIKHCEWAFENVMFNKHY